MSNWILPSQMEDLSDLSLNDLMDMKRACDSEIADNKRRVANMEEKRELLNKFIDEYNEAIRERNKKLHEERSILRTAIHEYNRD